MAEARKEGIGAGKRSPLEDEVAKTSTKGMVGSQVSEVGRPKLRSGSVGGSDALAMI